MRLDVMANMRGVSAFDELWARRTTIEMESGPAIEALSLPDLVMAKKTQRDKDWPMIRRLIESHYAVHASNPTQDQILFWLAQSRTPKMLVELAEKYPAQLEQIESQRPLVSIAKQGDTVALELALADEERAEREADRLYWAPLKAELEQLRRK